MHSNYSAELCDLRWQIMTVIAHLLYGKNVLRWVYHLSYPYLELLQNVEELKMHIVPILATCPDSIHA